MIADVIVDPRPRIDTNERRFLFGATGLFCAVGLALGIWPLIASLGPSAEVLTPLWIDLSDLPPGHRKTIYWGEFPIFIAHRTPEEIAEAWRLDEPFLDRGWTIFGEFDTDRVQRDEWVVVVGLDPYSGCFLTGQEPEEFRGKYGGWHDPCYGYAFDTSGRTPFWQRIGNLRIPPYRFISDTEIEIPYQR